MGMRSIDYSKLAMKKIKRYNFVFSCNALEIYLYFLLYSSIGYAKPILRTIYHKLVISIILLRYAKKLTKN